MVKENSSASLITVVDNDFRILESLESLVESAGYTAGVFPSGEAFLESQAVAAASCLVADVRMPNVDGLELQRRVKRNWPELPIILMTAHYDSEVKRRAIEGGAVGFLRKSFSGLEFLSRQGRQIEFIRAVRQAVSEPSAKE